MVTDHVPPRTPGATSYPGGGHRLLLLALPAVSVEAELSTAAPQADWMSPRIGAELVAAATSRLVALWDRRTGARVAMCLK